MNAETGEIVRNERLRRGWSMRRAAEAAGVSHTWWDLVERGAQRRHDKAREAVAQAFGWPLDWVENPPAPPVISQRDDEVLLAIASLRESVDLLRAEVLQLRREARPAASGSK